MHVMMPAVCSIIGYFGRRTLRSATLLLGAMLGRNIGAWCAEYVRLEKMSGTHRASREHPLATERQPSGPSNHTDPAHMSHGIRVLAASA